MRIGIDMDGCLSDDDRNRLDEVTKYLYENNLPEMDTPYGYERKVSTWTWVDGTFIDFRDKCMWDYWENAKCFKYADDITHKLHEDGHEIYIVTGRSLCQQQTEDGARLRKASEDFLIRNNIYYDKLLFSTFPKIDWFLNTKCDLVIEDFERTIKECAEYLPVLMFDNRYNRDTEGDNITRVFSWYDIYRKIKEKSYKGAK